MPKSTKHKKSNSTKKHKDKDQVKTKKSSDSSSNSKPKKIEKLSLPTRLNHTVLPVSDVTSTTSANPRTSNFDSSLDDRILEELRLLSRLVSSSEEFSEITKDELRRKKYETNIYVPSNFYANLPIEYDLYDTRTEMTEQEIDAKTGLVVNETYQSLDNIALKADIVKQKVRQSAELNVENLVIADFYRSLTQLYGGRELL